MQVYVPLFFSKNTSLNLTRGIIVDMMTPEAVMNAVICGVAFGTEEIRECSELSPLPSKYNELPFVFM